MTILLKRDLQKFDPIGSADIISATHKMYCIDCDIRSAWAAEGNRSISNCYDSRWHCKRLAKTRLRIFVVCLLFNVYNTICKRKVAMVCYTNQSK